MARTKIGVSLMILSMTVSLSRCGSKKGPEPVGTSESPPSVESGQTVPGESAETAESTPTASSIESEFPTVHFEFNQATIRGEDLSLLKKAAEMLKANSNSNLTIEGHCDERGSSEYNLALGERRAQSVKSYLRTLGIEGKRLATISYGEERPVDSGKDESAWAKNRRADSLVNR